LEYWTWHGVLAQWQVLWCLDCWHNHAFSTNCPSVPLFWQTTPFYCHVWVLLSFLLPASLHQSLWQRQILDLSGYKNTLLIPSASEFINFPNAHIACWSLSEFIDQLPGSFSCLLISTSEFSCLLINFWNALPSWSNFWMIFAFCHIDLLLNDDVSFFLFGLELLTGRIQIGKLAFLGFQTIAHTFKILHNF
jgi:hypothetical protein